jgi:hypothetical protein
VPTIDEIVVGDEPDAWRDAGFVVDADGVCRIGTVRVRLAGRVEGKRIRSWLLRDVVGLAAGAGGDIDGLPTWTTERPAAEPAQHPNGVIMIDHVVLATPDVARTVDALEAAGFVALRTRDTDTYGAPMRQTFFRAGEVIVELIGPQEPGGDGPCAFFGLAYTVDDIEETAAYYGARLGRVKDAVQPGRRIATLRHKELDLSVPTAFMSPEVDPATWRLAAPS